MSLLTKLSLHIGRRIGSVPLDAGHWAGRAGQSGDRGAAAAACGGERAGHAFAQGEVAVLAAVAAAHQARAEAAEEAATGANQRSQEVSPAPAAAYPLRCSGVLQLGPLPDLVSRVAVLPIAASLPRASCWSGGCLSCEKLLCALLTAPHAHACMPYDQRRPRRCEQGAMPRPTACTRLGARA